jgi:predicted sulfurtransferase
MIENQVLGGYRIQVDDSGVTTNNGVRTKTIAWQEIENVIAKDNILTVDMRNNYLMQSKFRNTMNDAVIAAFNEWCKGKLK